MRTHGIGLWVAVTLGTATGVGAAKAQSPGQLQTDRPKPDAGIPKATNKESETLDAQTARADAKAAAAGTKAAAAGTKAASVVRRVAAEAGSTVSDGWITSKVKTKLMADELVNARGIDIDTSNRIVHLKGSVRSESERNRAIETARETDGVWGVLDELKVGVGTPPSAAAPVPTSLPTR